jgi:hypothetical protein
MGRLKALYRRNHKAKAEDRVAFTERKSAATVYQKTVKYRIDFFLRNVDTYYPNRTQFLESKIHDDPVFMEKSASREKTVPVIEEVNTIEFGSAKNTWRKDFVPYDGLILDADDVVKPKTLHVRSSLLLNALRSVVKYSSHPPTGGEEDCFTSGVFPFPFKELYHHREELLRFKKETSGARSNHTPEYNIVCDEHIDILINYLDNEPYVQINTVKERWAQKVPTTTFASLWLLLKPGCDVYVQEYGQLNAYVVDAVHGGIDRSGSSYIAGKHTIRVWNLVHNGKTIVRRSKTIVVPAFDGELDITSLPLFPTSFHDKLDGGALRNALVERGNKFLRIARSPTFLEYTGPGLCQGWKKVLNLIVGYFGMSLTYLSIIELGWLSSIILYRGTYSKISFLVGGTLPPSKWTPITKVTIPEIARTEVLR